jgi:alpha-tubulin suppressor-like RCC1 family protein
MKRAAVVLLALGAVAAFPVAAISATVAAGYTHSVVVKTSDGTVWAWGANGSGQLGDGTTIQRMAAVRVGSLTGIVAVAAGANHALALKGDGTVWAWGDNQYGQVGEGSSGPGERRTTPVQVRARDLLCEPIDASSSLVETS